MGEGQCPVFNYALEFGLQLTEITEKFKIADCV